VRPVVTILVSSVLAAACSQLLGIDNRYSREDQAATASGGSPDDVAPADADKPSGNGGDAVGRPPDPMAAGGAAGGPPGELGPPPFESGGSASVPASTKDAGPAACQAGHKLCGDVCMPTTPEHGCGGISCAPCIAHENAGTSCSKDAACESVCNPGFAVVNSVCVLQPSGTGGSGGAGGATGSGGTGGSSDDCDPLQCPACSRGFEGCCIPAVPGVPGHCGCFYFPPLCTARVG
jgi:hypothetical protein